MMKRSILIVIVCLGFGGCVSRPEPTISAPGTDMKYEWTIEIPVVRPSSRNRAKLVADAIELTAAYGITNFLTRTDAAGVTVRDFSVPFTDGEWLKVITEGLWYDKGWNYEPGTVAHVYLRSGVGDAPRYWGRIIFMKNGKVFGGKATAGGTDLPDYYREMKELGIFIP